MIVYHNYYFKGETLNAGFWLYEVFDFSLKWKALFQLNLASLSSVLTLVIKDLFGFT